MKRGYVLKVREAGSMELVGWAQGCSNSSMELVGWAQGAGSMELFVSAPWSY